MLKLLLLFLVFQTLSFAADYFCPMHCEGKKTYEKEGICPVCKMYLTVAGDEGPLNLRDYRVDLKFDFTERSVPELQIVITPRLTKDGSILKDLDSREGTELEVYVTDQDLSYMEHFVPEKLTDGSFRFKKEASKSENSLLFVMLKPKGAKEQVFPLAMKVELPKSHKPSKTISISDKNPKPNEHVYLVIVSEDTTYFKREHVHSKKIKKDKNLTWLKKSLPKPGLYKVFIDNGLPKLSALTVKK